MERKTKYSARLTDLIEDRLTSYGYPKQMRPDKYQALAAVRKVLALRAGLTTLLGMTESQYLIMLDWLEVILPDATGTH